MSRPRIADGASESCRLPSSGGDKLSSNPEEAGPSRNRLSEAMGDWLPTNGQAAAELGAQ